MIADDWRKYRLICSGLQISDAIVFKADGKTRLPKKGMYASPYTLPSRLPYDNMIIAFTDICFWAFKFDPAQSLFDGDEFYHIGVIAFNSLTPHHKVTGKDIQNFVYYTFNSDMELVDTGMYSHELGEDSIVGKDDKFESYMSGAILLKFLLDFLSCSNIRTVKHLPPAKVQKKRRKHGKLPLVSYYTLEVQRGKAAKSGATGKGGWTNRVHLCRGHIMTYVKERPHVSGFVGNMWCPPHVKGNKKKGKIVKDYNLVGDK